MSAVSSNLQSNVKIGQPRRETLRNVYLRRKPFGGLGKENFSLNMISTKDKSAKRKRSHLPSGDSSCCCRQGGFEKLLVIFAGFVWHGAPAFCLFLEDSISSCWQCAGRVRSWGNASPPTGAAPAPVCWSWHCHSSAFRPRLLRASCWLAFTFPPHFPWGNGMWTWSLKTETSLQCRA